MRRRRWTILLLTPALALAFAGTLVAQEPEAGVPQEEKNPWHAMRDKGLSLLTPTLEKAHSHIQDMLEELNEKYLPAIKEAGYGASEIQVTVGMPTALTLQLKRFERIGEDRQKELLHEHRDDAIAVKMLEALFAANKIHIENFEANEVHISLGFPPSTTLVLTPVEETAPAS